LKARRFLIETWGCQMNELDSQRLAGQLMQQGMLPTTVAEEADLILLNSCSVREKAEHKVYSRLGEFRLLKSDRPEILIGLCGCVAQQEGERALRRVADLDFVLGTARVGELHQVLDRRAQSGRALLRLRHHLPRRQPQGNGDHHRGLRQELHLLYRSPDPRPRALSSDGRDPA
jgi:tRNA-2-methylthio-N6-dimethylallyladenosine synthase